VIDGPFGEAKEIVAGYWILQVESMDEAATVWWMRSSHGVTRKRLVAV
jgi:hypothetical protein